MTCEFDLVIRGGTVIDGTGREGYVADVGIRDGVISEIGKSLGQGRDELDAQGMLVTPGFVDVHTHYDGQVTWDPVTEPSSTHGVTTVVTGNCGVGFAPCRAEDRSRLVALMEGVEDIPEVVLTEGLAWNWETFPEYLDVLENCPHDIDVATMLPHACARVYVMGERAVDGEEATESDLAEMTRLSEQAMKAGAIGFGTSRSIAHKDSRGAAVPTKRAAETELMAFAKGMEKAGHGVIEAVFDMGNIEHEFAMLERIAAETRRPVSFTLAQTLEHPDAWRKGLPLLKQANEEGLRMKGQIIGRPTGLLLGFGVSYNPFSLRPSYVALTDLPLEERVRQLRQPEVRARILGEEDGPARYHALVFLSWFDRMFVLGDPPNYHQPLDQSIAALAEARGMTAEEYVYDMMLEGDGTNLIFLAVGNYVDGTLDAVSTMIQDDNTVLGLGDGGAHYALVCDAGWPTFMLAFWGRDASPERRMSLPAIVRKLSAEPAAVVDLLDRGIVAPGYKADLNVIDFENLRLHAPVVFYDLPGNGRRLKQPAEGFMATIVNGQTTYRNGKHTGALAGKLVRGPQPAPC